MRISVSGVDASLAEFNNLIFDANQAPLRLAQTGFQLVAGISFNDRAGGQNAKEGTPIPVYATPAGTSSVFMMAWRSQGDTSNRYWMPFYNDHFTDMQGGGGGICSNNLCPLNFITGAPGAPTVPGASNYISYAIFKNYN